MNEHILKDATKSYNNIPSWMKAIEKKMNKEPRRPYLINLREKHVSYLNELREEKDLSLDRTIELIIEMYQLIEAGVYVLAPDQFEEDQ